MRILLAYPRPFPSSDSQVQAGLPQLFPLPVITLRVCITRDNRAQSTCNELKETEYPPS